MKFACIDRGAGICSHHCVKFSLLLILAAITLSLNACTTLANRRDLYSPDKAHGPYTDALEKYEAHEIWIKDVRPNNHAELQ